MVNLSVGRILATPPAIQQANSFESTLKMLESLSFFFCLSSVSDINNTMTVRYRPGLVPSEFFSNMSRMVNLFQDQRESQLWRISFSSLLFLYCMSKLYFVIIYAFPCFNFYIEIEVPFSNLIRKTVQIESQVS